MISISCDLTELYRAVPAKKSMFGTGDISNCYVTDSSSMTLVWFQYCHWKFNSRHIFARKKCIRRSLVSGCWWQMIVHTSCGKCEQALWLVEIFFRHMPSRNWLPHFSDIFLILHTAYSLMSTPPLVKNVVAAVMCIQNDC